MFTWIENTEAKRDDKGNTLHGADKKTMEVKTVGYTVKKEDGKTVAIFFTEEGRYFHFTSESLTEAELKALVEEAANQK